MTTQLPIRLEGRREHVLRQALVKPRVCIEAALGKSRTETTNLVTLSDTDGPAARAMGTCGARH
jgi:hypothetical protein